MTESERLLAEMYAEPDPVKRAAIDGRRLSAMTAEDWAAARAGWVRVHLLSGVQLDYWVARALGHNVTLRQDGFTVHDWQRVGSLVRGNPFQPSTTWAQGGPIIDHKRISLDANPDSSDDGQWYADGQYGETALIAAMRSVVASVFGYEFPEK